MILTEPQVRRIMPKAKNDNVKAFVKTFNENAEAFGINTPIRVCHLIAQLAHESAELNATVENLNYSAEGLRKTFPKYFPTSALATQYARKPQAIANRVYANRMGNGSEASGDGWKYRGRGLIQLTGLSNYKAYQTSGYCVGDLLGHPEWLEKYPGCLKSAMWFWKKNGCNELADKDDCLSITKRINGGTNGYSSRAYYVRIAKKVFCI